jgi:hypothetical protein
MNSAVRPRPLPLSPAARIRSPSLWTPGTWACLPGRGPGVASGPVSGTGSCPARVDRGLLASLDLPANPKPRRRGGWPRPGLGRAGRLYRLFDYPLASALTGPEGSLARPL